MRSVVLAAYQGEKFIEAQLRSILAQIACEDEVLVSDDGSSDGTIEVVMRMHDARIRVLRNSNRTGYVRNFERAIDAARGEHIFFSDQDDIWLPHKVQSITGALDRKACVVSDAVVVDENLNRLHDSYFEFRKVHNFSFVATFLRPRFIGATMACRRDFIANLRPFPGNVPHDFWLSLNAIASRQLEVIRDPLILYRRHAATASTTATQVKRPMATILRERLTTAACLVTRRVTGN